MYNVDHNDIDLNLNNKYQYKEEPIHLINFKKDGFELNQEAINMIKSIEDDIIVVSVVGKARTGKSYLMNLLLENIGKEKSFEVQSSIASCTKGIWVWGNFRKKKNGNAKIIFIDSEGTSSVDRSTKTYDSKIFALVVLVSSLFLYNTNSVIDENGISELSLAGHLSNSIETKSTVNKDALLHELSPKFIWVIRDFTLEKVHPETGQPMSSKEYLEVCLRSKTSGKNSGDNNMIRQSILKYFHDRDCVTLVRPVENDEDLKKLNKIPFDKLKTDFRTDFMELKDKIFIDANPKRFNGKKLNGPTLANLLQEFVDVINKGGIPNINNAWDQVINKDIESFYRKAISNHKYKISELKECMEEDELLKNLFDIRYNSMLIFNKCEQLNPDIISNVSYSHVYNKTRRNLEDEISKEESNAIDRNMMGCKKICLEVLKNEYKELEKNVLDNYYSSTKLEELNQHFILFLNNYFSKSKGPEKLRILIDFVIEKHPQLIKSIAKKIGTENEVKLNDLNQKIQAFISQNEILENENKHLKDKDDGDYQEMASLKSSLQRANKEIEELKARIEELEQSNKDLRKKANDNFLKSTKPSSVPVINEGEEISQRKENPNKKAKECHCNCLAF